MFRFFFVLLSIGTIVAGWSSQATAQTSEETAAAEAIAVLKTHCFECHAGETREGGLQLTDRQSILQGGHSGSAISTNDVDASELVRRILSRDLSERMPPKGAPLADREIAALRSWIANQIPWPASLQTQDAVAISHAKQGDHWAWKPLMKPSVPSIASSDSTSDPLVQTLDRFVLAKLEQAGLTFSPMADQRTLIRRSYFDLTGLPPTYDEVIAFEQDTSEQAYEALVDRLLASPRYGERWARHWLDIVHYGDTHGYDKDKPRPNAWPYRDYVIRAFNCDKPYARFVQEQIAGDALYPGTRDGIEALGFISAGPWDFIGHAEVSESKIDGQIARNLDRDDMVCNTLGTFCSVTIGCARCHEHKFDPISQSDYYSLQAVFAALDRADRAYYANPETQALVDDLQTQRQSIAAQREQIARQIERAAGPELETLSKEIAALSQAPQEALRLEYGYHSAIENDRFQSKWVQIDLGQSLPLEQIVLFPCYDDFNGIGAGFGFPPRYRIEIGDDPKMSDGSQLTVERISDRERVQQLMPERILLAEAAQHPVVSARYVRITATELASRQNDFIFALAELQVLNERQENVAKNAKVAALDSIEAAPRWRRANLTDGIFATSEGGARLAEFRRARNELLARVTSSEDRQSLTDLENAFSVVEQKLASLPAPDHVYSGTVHRGTGTFVGTGVNGGKPRTIRILARGNVTSPTREVQAGALSLFQPLAHHFDLLEEHSEQARRVALARWLTDSENHLTWRSIVNRVWQFHFGRGLVETPEDFGRMGAKPSHPELLDWLACEFRDGTGSLQQLHKQIVMSRTYRQSSTIASDTHQQALAMDTDNRLLWRQNRRKLDAESVRDAILMCSGNLNIAMGGPGFQDFVVERPEHSPHYEYGLSDPKNPALWRRSIYRFIVRSQTQPFMTSFDCADPSMRVDRRNETISAAQALALLNNGLVTTHSQHLAERAEQQAGNDVPKQVELAVRWTLQREPSPDELSWMVAYTTEHGLINLARVLMNVNEFVFVD